MKGWSWYGLWLVGFAWTGRRWENHLPSLPTVPGVPDLKTRQSSRAYKAPPALEKTRGPTLASGYYLIVLRQILTAFLPTGHSSALEILWAYWLCRIWWEPTGASLKRSFWTLFQVAGSFPMKVSMPLHPSPRRLLRQEAIWSHGLL